MGWGITWLGFSDGFEGSKAGGRRKDSMVLGRTVSPLTWTCNVAPCTLECHLGGCSGRRRQELPPSDHQLLQLFPLPNRRHHRVENIVMEYTPSASERAHDQAGMRANVEMLLHMVDSNYRIVQVGGAYGLWGG